MYIADAGFLKEYGDRYVHKRTVSKRVCAGLLTVCIFFVRSD